MMIEEFDHDVVSPLSHMIQQKGHRPATMHHKWSKCVWQIFVCLGQYLTNLSRIRENTTIKHILHPQMTRKRGHLPNLWEDIYA